MKLQTSTILTALFSTLFLTLVTIPSTVSATALTYKVGSKEKACFYTFNDKPGKKIGFYFAVQQGGSFDIDFEIQDPKGDSILKATQEKQGDYVFVGNLVGEYSFCFSNEMSTWADKLVDFEITLENEPPLEDKIKKDEKHDKAAAQIEESLIRISSGVTQIIRKQKYLRTRENRNFGTVESTEERIFWFSSLESVAIVAMACLQVFVIKSFFNVKRGGV